MVSIDVTSTPVLRQSLVGRAHKLLSPEVIASPGDNAAWASAGPVRDRLVAIFAPSEDQLRSVEEALDQHAPPDRGYARPGLTAIFTGMAEGEPLAPSHFTAGNTRKIILQCGIDPDTNRVRIHSSDIHAYITLAGSLPYEAGRVVRE